MARWNPLSPAEILERYAEAGEHESICADLMDRHTRVNVNAV